MDFSQINISSNLLRGIVGYDPIQINIYGEVNNKSIIAELKKLYPNAINEIDTVFSGNITMNKRIMGNPRQKRFSHDVFTTK